MWGDADDGGFLEMGEGGGGYIKWGGGCFWNGGS